MIHHMSELEPEPEPGIFSTMAVSMATIRSHALLPAARACG
jgi:hypothetical protein